MAFLGTDGWKSGLPPLALNKIGELESAQDKLNKERAQKQMRIETLEQTIEKLRKKVRNLRAFISSEF